MLLQQRKQAWRRLAEASGGDILQLNVGGESFVVTRGTLTQVTACIQLLPAIMIAH